MVSINIGANWVKAYEIQTVGELILVTLANNDSGSVVMMKSNNYEWEGLFLGNGPI